MTAGQFERAIARSAAGAGAALAIESHRATAWHSATFSGDRHELIVRGSPAAALATWGDDLPALDLPLPGHLLADLRVAYMERCGELLTLRIEGLTVAC